MKRIFILLLTATLSLSALAIDPGQVFEDPAMQARYEKLIEEVRCLKCQNQSLKDSNAFLASDLRLKIQEMMEEGKSDDEIKDFLVARYGEFALYRPRARGKTLVLWLAPGLLLLGGGFVLWRVVQRRMAMPIDEEPLEER